MKVHWLKQRKIIILFLSLALLIVCLESAQAKVKSLSRKEALLIAESTKEVELFYQMHGGKLKNCIDREVIKPCESDWVTCIEDAWVVQFTVGEVCSIRHDGRLGITILIDALTGAVISRFPEASYFANAAYCLEDYDCVCTMSVAAEQDCQNFIFGQISKEADLQCKDCQCINHSCQRR